MMFGYRKVDGAFVADPEKAIIDMIYFNIFYEYADEMLEKNKVDLSTLSRYLAMAGVGTIRRRIERVLNGLVVA